MSKISQTDNLPSLTQFLELLREHVRTLSESKEVNRKQNLKKAI